MTDSYPENVGKLVAILRDWNYVLLQFAAVTDSYPEFFGIFVAILRNWS